MNADPIEHELDALFATQFRAGDIVVLNGDVKDLTRSLSANGEIYDSWLRHAHEMGVTLVVPTFTYSFERLEPFSVTSTPSRCGEFSEWFRRRPEARRSRDPMYAMSAIGPLADGVVRNVSAECFGPGSVWDRLLEQDAVFCIVGPRLTTLAFRHYERILEVPYCYDKLLTGSFSESEDLVNGAVIDFVHDATNEGTCPKLEVIDEKARATGVVRVASVGSDELLAYRSRAMFDLVANAIAEEPWILTAAHGASQPPNLFDELRPSAKIPAIPGDAGAWRILRTIWPFERHLISDGYDIALRTLASVIPIKQRMFPTGMHAWTWIVPERWRCDEATVRTTDGRVVFSSRDNPLHVASYSMPKQGRISRDELMSHLVTHAIPDAVPFAYRYYRRDWTLCCSLEQAARLTDDFYDVEIRARFSRGKLAVGELIIPGKSERTVMLCAHLCHPSMANDDAAGVAVAVEVARRLLGRDGANEFTYVLTIVPETIGTVAYLSSNDTLRTKLVGGLFFEMLALPYPHALQLSLNGDTVFDRLWALICREHDPASRTGPFLGVITNDERQYNAPGVGVPMLSLSRVLPRSSPEYPYREYHSDHDSIDICSPEALEDSVDLSMKMLDALERNVIAVPKFRGEVFLSRYGLDVARHTDVMFVMDGRRTIADIALKLGLAFEEARSLVEDFHRAGLVDTRSAFDAA